VRDDARKFGRKFEILMCPFGPIFDDNNAGNPIKRGINFDIIENMLVILRPTGIVNTGRCHPEQPT